MGTTADLDDGDHRPAKRAMASGPPWVRRAAPAVQEAAEHTELWWAVAAAMATFGGWRGCTAAAAGPAAMTTAQMILPLQVHRGGHGSGAHHPSGVTAGGGSVSAAAALVRAAPRLPWPPRLPWRRMP
ncbi:hypothetical protein [Streptomyces sp. NPDC050759]|uniref:hypothetical protein n=1 Tax=Streptomyces sp. NPDC050759 TaxID=3365635 RepID=UPI0037AF7A76